MHGHRRIAEHGFRAGGCDYEIVLAVDGAGAIGQGVAAVPQVAVFVAVLDLEIGNGGGQFRVPVHQPLAAVDQPLLVQAHEDLDDRVGEPLVQGEAVPGPVHRRAHAPQLPGDVAAGAFLPLPYALDEGIAADLPACPAFAVQLAFHQHLGGDTGVVGPHLPECAPAVHAVITDEGIHERVLKGVPHVQAAGDVGRWNGDAVAVAVAGRGEVAGGFPGFVQFALYGMRVETALHVSALPIRPARGGRADSPGRGSNGSAPGRSRASRPRRFPRRGRSGPGTPAHRPRG